MQERHDVVIGQWLVTANIEYSYPKSQTGRGTAKQQRPESFNLSSKFNREYIFVTIFPVAAIDAEFDPV